MKGWKRAGKTTQVQVISNERRKRKADSESRSNSSESKVRERLIPGSRTGTESLLPALGIERTGVICTKKPVTSMDSNLQPPLF